MIYYIIIIIFCIGGDLGDERTVTLKMAGERTARFEDWLLSFELKGGGNPPPHPLLFVDVCFIH